MRIYNTLTGKKQDFIPLEQGKVKMYACGITVSGEAHIGHAYQALIYDIIRKYLEKIGYDVTYARNYTDVDDKIIAKSNETGIPADVYAKMMIDNTFSEFVYHYFLINAALRADSIALPFNTGFSFAGAKGLKSIGLTG